MATNVPVTLDTLITIKIAIQGSNRKFKIPLRDLGAHILPDKLRTLLSIPSNQEVLFERYSDSAGAYITLDSDNAQVYKTLFRAAKAKLKLRLRATLISHESETSSAAAPAQNPVPSLLPSTSRFSNLSTLAVSPPLVPTQTTPTIARSSLAPRPADIYNYNPMTVSNIAMSEPNKSIIPPPQPLGDKADSDGEAPVPRPFPAHNSFFAGLTDVSRGHDLAFRMKDHTAAAAACSWVVYCNNCDQPMANEHFHCSICDNGDYDLCLGCVESGTHCPGAGHWMVKRFVKNGTVVNSTTERIAPKVKTDSEKEMPGAFTEEKKPEVYESEQPTRTCNSCVKIFPEKDFVTCTTCDDYDLCMDCHVGTKHGHHPGHAFKPATSETSLTGLADILCNEGRNVRHAAVCDGCEKFIYGVRHKCLNCPDWDFCSTCIKSAKFIHPNHRFVPIYEPLPEPRTSAVRHYGIYCDGPLCKDKENLSWIEGVRYKCAVCHDTDFCANCEAIPSNRHNRTHPLIKFKTPVRNVSVTTMGEDKNGVAMTTMGDLPARRSTATETVPVAPSANAATQVQTIVDLKPSNEPVSKPMKEKIEIKDLLAEPIQENIKAEDLFATPVPEMTKVEPVSPPEPPKVRSLKPVPSSELNAHFIRDTIPDGTKVAPNHQFTQVWTLRNPGPHAWPAGCSVRYVGGDNMLNVDDNHPSTAIEIAKATESNVIGRPVEVGEEISFRVLMKASKREGTAISYWRLKAADGTPFGHRLWCHIDVSNLNNPILCNSPPAIVPTSPQTTPSVIPETAGSSSNEAYRLPLSMPDYKMQLMLLEQQNKKRILLARQEQTLAELSRKRAQVSTETQEALQAPPEDPAARERFAHRLVALRHAALQRMRRDVEQQRAREQAKEAETESAKIDVKQQNSEKSPVEEQAREEVAEDESAQQLRTKGSVMIFPQLDKESPVSSTHEATDIKPEAEETKSENAALAAPSEHEDAEFFEDAESVEIMDASSDDGFLTDEEYDILDASDEEMP
ncbi:hypothetical protein K432DRAFT_406661 [Lepidopterella palustris CBS 459.81]|uniref:ZZ-type domain-containing protein n=1 Tax=Lepidopterella palustris CBS 459.81 TaxID=1314670 RepID=A0A8E2JDB1_9PEZI|nr:hypothetical protein K432DRAFT_406661 [Lepidopterella palustris CBS 459.81]